MMSRKRTFAVIGLGRFGAAMATTLADLGHEVVGIDRDDEAVSALADRGLQTLQLDATDERALRAAGIHVVDVAVVSIGENIEASLITVMLLKELGIKMLVAKANTALHGRILEKLGVSRVVFPEREMAIRMAHRLAVPSLLDYIELSPDYAIIELPAPAQFVGKTLKEVQLRNRYGLTLIATRRRTASGEEVTNVAPAADDRFEDGDVMALLGSSERLAQLDALVKKGTGT
jgi:trk system potassium uptake protein TrkA